MGSLIYFLIVYSLDEAKIIHQDEFVDRELAVSEYTATENRYRDSLDRFEIVLIGADSIDTVTKTHGHYFSNSDDSLFSRFLIA